MSTKNLLFVVITLFTVVVTFLGYKYYQIEQKERSRSEQHRIDSIRHKEVLDSIKVANIENSLRLERVRNDSLIKQAISLAATASSISKNNDSLKQIIAGEDFTYSEIHPFNVQNLESQSFTFTNLLKWTKVNPNSRTVEHIPPLSDDIHTLLIFAVTGEDKIKTVKNAINNAIQGIAITALTLNKRMRIIAELIYETELLQNMEVLDVNTSVDRCINMTITNYENAEKWRQSPAKANFTPWYRFERRAVCKEILKGDQIPKGRFSICIENPSQEANVDFAIQIIGIGKKNNSSENTRNSIINPSPTQFEIEESTLKKEDSEHKKVSLFKCKPYSIYIGDYYGVQIISSTDCERVSNRVQEFRGITGEKNVYCILSKKDKSYKGIVERFRNEQDARDMAAQIRKKFPKDKDFRGAMITQYSAHMIKK